MSEILFRGKRCDNGEWEKGYLIQDTEFYGKEDKHSYIVNNSHPSGCFGRDIYIEVIPETVGQYTGVTDKNDTKIFEGDIVEYCYLFRNGDYKSFKADVKSGIESFGAYHRVYGFCAFLEFGTLETSEIIGNIHDNPELLKGGEDNV